MKEESPRKKLQAALEAAGFGYEKIAKLLTDAADSKSEALRVRVAEDVAKIFEAMPSSAQTNVNVSRTDQRTLVLSGDNGPHSDAAKYLESIQDPTERRRLAEHLERMQGGSVIQTETVEDE